MKNNQLKHPGQNLLLRGLLVSTLTAAITTPAAASGIAEADDLSHILFQLSLKALMDIPITVASGFEQALADAPSTVTLITEAQWQAMGASHLAEVLETIPGVHVGLSQAALTTDVYTFRGMFTNLNSQVMILIDGEHVKSAAGGSTLFGFRKSLTGLKQIEVIRGPGSAIYGADSFAGVINLVTKKAADKKHSTSKLGFRAGSFHSQHGWLENSGRVGAIDYYLSVDLYGSDDDNQRKVDADLQTNLDNVFGTNASLAPGVIDNHFNIQDITLNLAGDSWQADIWHYRNNNAGLGPGATQALDPTGHFTNGITLAKVSLDLSHVLSGSAAVDFSAQREFLDVGYHLFPAGAILPIGSDGNVDFATPTTVTLFSEGFLGSPTFVNQTFNLSFSHLFEPTEQHKIRWQIGGNYKHRDISELKNFGPTILNGTETLVDGSLTNVNDTPALYGKDTKEHFTFLSLQDEWKMTEDLTAVLGWRHDRYESFGSTSNPRVSLLWHPNDKLTTKLQYGSAFRAPTANERFFRNNPVTLGFEHLQPEQVDTSELSIDYQWHDNLLSNITFYQYKTTNLIEYVFDPQRNGNVAQNIGKQDGRGVEATLKWRVAQRLNVELNYAHVNAQNGQHQDIHSIPQNQYYAAINWQFAAGWQLHSSINRVSDRVRQAGDSRAPIADYNMAKMKIQHNDWLPGMDVALIINNLFDQNARAPSNGAIAKDYPLAGRQLLLEVNYRF